MMKKLSTIKSRTALSLAALTVGLLVSASPAKAEGTERGGGSAVGGSLLSFYENEGSIDFNPTESAVYSTRVAPILESVRAALPGFAIHLEKALAKNWYLEPKTLAKCPDDGALIQIETVPVACQNDVDVRVNQDWFENRAKGDEARAALILHELVRGIYLVSQKTKKPITPEAVHSVDRLLAEKPFPSRGRLLERLRKFGFGEYLSAPDVALPQTGLSPGQIRFDSFVPRFNWKTNRDRIITGFGVIGPRPLGTPSSALVVPVDKHDAGYTRLNNAISVLHRQLVKRLVDGNATVIVDMNALHRFVENWGDFPATRKIAPEVVRSESGLDDPRSTLEKLLLDPAELSLELSASGPGFTLHAHGFMVFTCWPNEYRDTVERMLEPVVDQLELLKKATPRTRVFADFLQLEKICGLWQKSDFTRSNLEISNNLPFVFHSTSEKAGAGR